MKFYYADANISHFADCRNAGMGAVLVSYYYLVRQPRPVEAWATLFPYDVFLDSGAFTAWKQNLIIDIEKYIEYLHIVKHAVELYASLDVIQEPEISMKNWEYMRKQDLNPLPVFHANESYDFLKEYVKQVDYVALGGVAGLPWAKKKIYKHFDACFEIIGRKVKVHGFGVCNLDYLIKYPFYSADGTSWLAPAMWGKDNSYDLIRRKQEASDPFLYQLWKKQSSPHDRRRYGYISMAKMIEFVTETWTKRGITWND